MLPNSDMWFDLCDGGGHMNGSMIALYPPLSVAESLAVPDGLPADQIHLTIAYTGPAGDVDQTALQSAARLLAQRRPVRASISGHARFTGAEQDVIVALVDGADLEDLRRDTLKALADLGINVPREHGFQPHCTIAYINPGDSSPVDRIPTVPLLFNAINAVHADSRSEYTFASESASDPRPAAREAFADGWASVRDAPMTDEVRAASIAATAWACEHADRPDVLEATIKIGQLEGTWALIYQRREKREQQHQAVVLAAWAKFLQLVALDELVSSFHAQAPNLPDQSPQAIQLQALAIARQAFIGTNMADPAYRQLLDSITTALADAQAEGAAAGHAIRGRTDSMSAAYDDARDQITDLSAWGKAPAVAAQIMSGAASTLARILAKGFAAKLTAASLLAAVLAALTDRGSRVVAAPLDVAMSGAYAQGAMAVYAADGVTMVNFWTAGDSRVCATCQGLEDGNPYQLDAAPSPDQHPNCRCVLTPIDASVPGAPPPPIAIPEGEE